MGPTDTLSQKDDVDMDDDNREITLLKNRDQYFHIKSLDTALVTKISNSSSHDPIVSRALDAINNSAGEPWLP